MDRSDHITTERGGASPAPPRSSVEILNIVDLPHVVDLHDANDLHHALNTVMPGWFPSTTRNLVAPNMPATIIRGREDGSYDFQSSWRHRSLKKLGLAGATCAVVADVSQAFCDANPGALGLHCGAVRIGPHLVALTGTYRAGKSTLVTRLAIEPGLSLFCDDILPILPDGKAFGLGIQPRLRLPLPQTISPVFRTFVDENLTVQDQEYGFVCIPTLAARGASAHLSAIVILSRKEGAAATLHQVETAEVASYLIRQNIADPGEIDAHYDQITDIAEKLLCLKLQYSDLEDAVSVLLDVFGENAIPSPGARILPPLPPEPMTTDCESADLRMVYKRCDLVIQRTIGSDIFLWQIEERNFYSLNPVAAAIWSLLETPKCGLTITGILQEAFPDCEATKIEKDTAELFDFLQTRNLISICQAK